MHADRQKNYQALHLLYHWVKKSIRDSHIPSIQLSEKEQKGNSFGARISAGLQKLFAEGYDHVIVVGNDCPRMNAADLVVAREHLEQGQLVLGKDADGGAYIFGLSKENFAPSSLEALPWNSSELGTALKDHLLSHGDVVELAIKEDINDEQDLQEVIGSSSLSLVLVLLKKLFHIILNRGKALPIHYVHQRIPGHPFRGPPRSMSLL